jgi:hypothetical protein
MWASEPTLTIGSFCSNNIDGSNTQCDHDAHEQTPDEEDQESFHAAESGGGSRQRAVEVDQSEENDG